MGGEGFDKTRGGDPLGGKAASAGDPAGGAQAHEGAASPPVLASGRAVGGQTVTGVGRYVASDQDLEALRPGEILMAEFTLPEWQPVMERAAAIITNQGGHASHAAVVARRLGVPAIVGTVDGASMLWTGATLTVSCGGGEVGRVYEGAYPSEASPDGTAAPSRPARPRPLRPGWR
ncbi:MAG: PEP-utilizing enzyme [Caulobacteraceae bacterium]|nr:PEP-utilizing enzyme [Caulobacteraceae bacterium]